MFVSSWFRDPFLIFVINIIFSRLDVVLDRLPIPVQICQKQCTYNSKIDVLNAAEDIQHPVLEPLLGTHIFQLQLFLKSNILLKCKPDTQILLPTNVHLMLSFLSSKLKLSNIPESAVVDVEIALVLHRISGIQYCISIRQSGNVIHFDPCLFRLQIIRVISAVVYFKQILQLPII